ncbi:helix-turn-helix domain-containing protein [Archangium lansingense]|uniref:AlbA family DNA-binding domain-containing protein n=1 Tax=Archangium lansingense TaxID=2995310 RepID=UPI003B792FB0
MTISHDLIRQLVSRRESPILDFKEKFYENSPDGTAELAKDLMAMANSLHDGEQGYLLFGVAEDPVEHFGIIKGFEPQQWMTDSNLQQKVRLLLNRVPVFLWSQINVDGCMIGVIEVRSGGRPFYPLRDGKKLQRHVALHRVGSSTDVASPDEIVGWSRSGDDRRATALQLEQLEQELSVVPSLVVGVMTRTGSTRKQEIHVSNDGNAPFSISSARCSWRLSEQAWRQWLQSVSLRYLAEIPPFVQQLRFPPGTIRGGEHSTASILVDVSDVYVHVRRHFASSVEGVLNETPPLAEFLVGEVVVECQGLSKGRTRTVELALNYL